MNMYIISLETSGVSAEEWTAPLRAASLSATPTSPIPGCWCLFASCLRPRLLRRCLISDWLFAVLAWPAQTKNKTTRFGFKRTCKWTLISNSRIEAYSELVHCKTSADAIVWSNSPYFWTHSQHIFWFLFFSLLKCLLSLWKICRPPFLPQVLQVYSSKSFME